MLSRARCLSILRRVPNASPFARRSLSDVFAPSDDFLPRHMGSQGKDKQTMLDKLGFATVDSLIDSTIPPSIRLPKPLKLDKPMTETEALASLKQIMGKNKVYKSFIGAGYYETITPGVILRNVLENPGWYEKLRAFLFLWELFRLNNVFTLTFVIQYKVHCVHALSS